MKVIEVVPFEEIKRFMKLVEAAYDAFHRAMIVFTGSDDEKLAAAVYQVLEAYCDFMRDKLEEGEKLQGVYFYQPEFSDGMRRYTFSRNYWEKGLKRILDMEFRPYKETEEVLGATYDIAVLDLINDLKPNDIGRVGGIVRGGGIYVLMTPPFDKWDKIITKFQQNLLVPQYGPEHIRHYFKKRFVKKLLEHDNIAIYDLDAGKWIKEPVIRIRKKHEFKEIRIPEKTVFPQKVYKLALTQDQVKVLKTLEVLYERPPKDKKRVVVVTADRGRGKSCAIGIGLVALAHKIRRAKGQARIIVTAPSESNVQSLFELALKTFRMLGYDPDVEKKGRHIVSIEAKSIFIDYVRPFDVLQRSRADIVAVDEAAGIPVPLLFKIHQKFNRLIFSSTIHGYEGAGRGFSVRFLKYLRKDPNTEIYEVEMEEPIRYAEDDPIERWLFDVLLLDAEPAPLTPEDEVYVKNLEVEYYIPDMEKFFLENEKELRQFFGIYVQAHYRNRPDDLAMMMDAPHHTIRALKLKSGKIVVSVELAEEGPIPDDMIEDLIKGVKLPGNIIPDRVVKYWRVKEFAKMRGWRIVRIATHPDVQGRGLGSKMLEFIVEEAKKRGYDWVGTGFGVNYELLKFWIKNGFIPVHISPERNPVSGEYSILMIKPLTKKAEELVRYMNKEFRLRLINSLCGPYFDLEYDIAHLLLKDWGVPVKEDYKPQLTEAQVHRIVSYAWGPMTYENVVDVLMELVKAYFYDVPPSRPKLSTLQEYIMINKVLQSKTWRLSSQELKMPPVTLMLALRDIAKVLVARYIGKVEIPLFYATVTKG